MVGGEKEGGRGLVGVGLEFCFEFVEVFDFFVQVEDEGVEVVEVVVFQEVVVGYDVECVVGVVDVVIDGYCEVGVQLVLVVVVVQFFFEDFFQVQVGKVYLVRFFQFVKCKKKIYFVFGVGLV